MKVSSRLETIVLIDKLLKKIYIKAVRLLKAYIDC